MRLVFTVLLLSALCSLIACREQSREELFQQGMAFVEAGNYQASVTLFKDALEKDPNYTEARIQLGTAYLKTDKIDKAEQELEKALRQEPGSPIVSLRLAEIYLATGRPEKAVSKLEGFENSDPVDPEILRLLGKSHAMLGRYAVSEALFRKALSTDASHSATQLDLAQLLYVTGRMAEGDQLVDQLIKSDPGNVAAYSLLMRRALQEKDLLAAVAALEKIRSIKPDDAFSAYMLAMIYLDEGDTGRASQVSSALARYHPEHPAIYRIDGIISYQQGQYETAIEKLSRSLQGMPDLPGYYFLGLANYRKGQLEQALNSFQKALDKSPGHLSSRLMIAQTLLKQGRLDDSIRQAAMVVKEGTLAAEANNLIGSAYLLQGKYDLGMEYIEKAIQINPELAQAHFKKGLFNLAKGNREQGEADLFNALNAAPEVLNVRLLLATYYIRQNNYPKAQQILEEGLAISPDSAVIFNLLSATAFGQNRPEEAVQNLQRAKKIKPDYFTPYFNLASYYMTKKNYKAALGEYQAVLQVNAGYVPALLKMATLHELLDQDAEAESFYKSAAKSLAPEGFLALAAFQKRSGNLDGALQTLQNGYAERPDIQELVMAYADSLVARKRFDDAIPIYVHLEEIMPGKGKPMLLGVHLKKGDFAAASEIAEQAISANPASEKGYLFQALIYEYRAEWSRAEETLLKGLAASENALALQVNLARFYMMRGSNDKALKLYDEILHDKPNLSPVIFAKASIVDMQGNKKQAQSLYERILAIDERYAPALNNLALLLIDVYADHKRAMELAVKAFQIKPNDPRILDTLGYAMLKNDQVDKSLVFLEKAAKAMPEEASVQIHLAQAYKILGRNDEALQSLAAVKESNARAAQLEEAQALLKELN